VTVATVVLVVVLMFAPCVIDLIFLIRISEAMKEQQWAINERQLALERRQHELNERSLLLDKRAKLLNLRSAMIGNWRVHNGRKVGRNERN
jgi:hypothetical protein